MERKAREKRARLMNCWVNKAGQARGRILSARADGVVFYSSRRPSTVVGSFTRASFFLFAAKGLMEAEGRASCAHFL